MWSSDGPRRRLLAAALAVGALSLVAGCGFRPLYGTARDAGPAAELSRVAIRGIEGRTGQQLHNMLRDRLTPKGQPADPSYALDVVLTVSTRELGIRKDETASRANLILVANIRLTDVSSGQVLVTSVLRTVNSYNILDAFYASVVSRQDATERGLRQLANGIAWRLALYFADPDPDVPA